MFVLGTAGHVDHGKSTLLKCLTGLQPDRLPEEKKRGMTIDLNFVWLETDRGKVGIVDVPGHERFVKNMVAGVGGIDAFLFVVAADDGWMPQSEEHLNVLHLLGIRDGVLVITKTDLVEAPRASEVKKYALTRIQDRLGCSIAAVTFSASQPDQASQVRKALNDLVVRKSVPEAGEGARIWVDRVFNPRGKGVVVTGTLREGALNKGDVLFHWPRGKQVSVKGLESYHQSAARVDPVIRAAIQLGQVELADLSRGHLFSKIAPVLSKQLDARVSFIEKAPRRNIEIKFYLGSLEVECLCIPFEKGKEAIARIKFAKPIPVRMGERFLLRLSGEEKTLGGGVILDVFGRSRNHSQALERLKDASLSAESFVRLEALFEGVVSKSNLRSRSIFSTAAVERALEGKSFRKIQDGYALKEQVDALSAFLKKTLATPVTTQGLQKLIAGKFSFGLLQALLEEGLSAGLWELTRKGYALKSHQRAEKDPREETILTFLRGSEKPVVLEDLTKHGPKELVFALAKAKRVVQLADNYFMDYGKYKSYGEKVENFLKEKGQAGMAELKPLLDNSSRKNMVLILEKMDADRLTFLKDGVRRLLKK